MIYHDRTENSCIASTLRNFHKALYGTTGRTCSAQFSRPVVIVHYMHLQYYKNYTANTRPLTICNRPFPSSLVPLFQGESKCETILMKMTLICMKMKLHAELIFIWKVSYLDSLWNRGTGELGNVLLVCCSNAVRIGNQMISSAIWNK